MQPALGSSPALHPAPFLAQQARPDRDADRPTSPSASPGRAPWLHTYLDAPCLCSHSPSAAPKIALLALHRETSVEVLRAQAPHARLFHTSGRCTRAVRDASSHVRLLVTPRRRGPHSPGGGGSAAPRVPRPPWRPAAQKPAPAQIHSPSLCLCVVSLFLQQKDLLRVFFFFLTENSNNGACGPFGRDRGTSSPSRRRV